MSNEVENVPTEGEQVEKIITEEPKKNKVKVPKKQKDPKKIAAGRKLAEYNKMAKEALEEKRRKMESEASEADTTKQGWLPDTRGVGILSVIVIGLTAFVIVSRYSLQNKFTTPTTVGVGSSSQPPNYPTPSEEQRYSKIPIPTHRLKVGME